MILVSELGIGSFSKKDSVIKYTLHQCEDKDNDIFWELITYDSKK